MEVSMLRIHRKLDSETLHLPELKPLIGRTVEITVEEQVPEVRDEFYAELARLPETEEAYELQKVIFRQWRNDPRFEPYWVVLDHALVRSFEEVRKWAEARAAVADLDGYDFDAYKKQREYDQQHAGDHLV
jgi:hypothetical protein